MKIPKSRLVLFSAFALILAFFIFQMNLLPGIKPGPGRQKGFALLATLLDIIKHDYLEETDPLRTADGAFRGLVNSLDALSCYLDKNLTLRFRAGTESSAEPGLVMFKQYNDFPQVRGVFSGSPAEKAGIRIGDIVSAVGGRDTLRMSLTEVNLTLLGEDESPVTLKVLRGGETLEVSVPRARLHPEPLSFGKAENGLPVLTVHRFTPPLATAAARELRPLLSETRVPLIIDLRNCSTGEIEEARAFVNLFLRAATIGSFGKKAGARKKLACTADPTAPKLPLVVWIGPGTMGPAELVAGVFQELGRADIVGTPTLGLVARQDFFPLKDGSSVLLTTGIFSLPSGKLLWNEGIDPDEELPRGEFSDQAYLKLTAPLSAKR
jgi:carboxyl-terminal processing protease